MGPLDEIQNVVATNNTNMVDLPTPADNTISAGVTPSIEPQPVGVPFGELPIQNVNEVADSTAAVVDVPTPQPEQQVALAVNAEEIFDSMTKNMTSRRDKQPLEYPNAGSTFKRPEGYFAGKLIEDCGLKGYTVGGAQISEKHAGFTVNIGGATSSDVLSLIEHTKNTVKKSFNVELENEIIYLPY